MVYFFRFMSTLETAESVLGISDRGADRLEDEMDYVEVVGDGAGSAIGGASGLSFLDVAEKAEVRASSVLYFRFLVRYDLVLPYVWTSSF